MIIKFFVPAYETTHLCRGRKASGARSAPLAWGPAVWPSPMRSHSAGTWPGPAAHLWAELRHAPKAWTHSCKRIFNTTGRRVVGQRRRTVPDVLRSCIPRTAPGARAAAPPGPSCARACRPRPFDVLQAYDFSVSHGVVTGSILIKNVKNTLRYT